MPSLQEQAIRMTRNAVETIFRTARHVPADKRDWVPMGAARPVHQQVAEVALTPVVIGALLDRVPAERIQEIRAGRDAAIATLHTLDLAEEVAQKNYEAFFTRIGTLSNAELDEEVFVPMFNRIAPIADLIFFAHMNATYHIGQINYIQLLLGDTEMH